MAQGKVTFFEDRCKGCGLCVSVCPKKIIKLRTDRINVRGFNPAGVDNMDECIGCASCAIVCPDCVIQVER